MPGRAHRSACNLKLGRHNDALGDAAKAVKLDDTNPKAHLRKGMAFFELGEAEAAGRERDVIAHSLDAARAEAQASAAQLAAAAKRETAAAKASEDNRRALEAARRAEAEGLASASRSLWRALAQEARAQEVPQPLGAQRRLGGTSVLAAVLPELVRWLPVVVGGSMCQTCWGAGSPRWMRPRPASQTWLRRPFLCRTI